MTTPDRHSVDTIAIRAAALLFSICLTHTADAGTVRSAAGKATARHEYTDQLIIRYKDDTLVRSASAGSKASISAVSGRLGSLSSRAGTGLTHHRYMSGNGQVVKLPGRVTLAQAMALAETLKGDANVASVEPDRRMRPLLIPNDTQYDSLWNLYPSTSYAGGANLPGAWDLTTGSASIVVAVVDTGIVPHADLTGRSLAGYNFISNAVMAGNSTGRSSDATDMGDFVTTAESNDPNSVLYECDVENSSWHSTHVAGTIGAIGNNGSGVAGINWTSPILPVRVLGKCGGYVSDIVDGMRWAAGLSVTGVPANSSPARVINLSLGTTGSCDTTFQSAVNDVIAAGATVVVAAGNESNDVSNSSPANCSGVIAVAAVGSSGGKADYSNYGSGITIAAPGGDSTNGILSTLNSSSTTPTPSPGGDIYASYKGTSMATAHVSGIASLMLSRYQELYPDLPLLSGSQVATLLQSSARNFPTSSCTTTICGAGIIDAAAAVASVQQPIVSTTAITIGSLTSASSGGNVTSPNGSAVTARGVCWSTSGNPTTSLPSCSNDGSGTGSFTSSISGVAVNTLYYVRAYATNSAGTTYGNQQTFYIPKDTSLPTVTSTAPSAITTTGATSGGNVVSDGGATVTARGICWSTTANPTRASTCSFSGSGTGAFNATITDLSEGLTYHVRAFVTNAVGTAYGLDQNFSTTLSTPPTVITTSPTMISTSSAAAGGNVTLGGSAAVTARGVCRSTTANPTILSGTCTTNGTGTGTFSATLTGLSANTRYNLRAYATSTAGTSYGSNLAFTTLSAATTPSVLTRMPARSVTATSATIDYRVQSSGGATVTRRGVCWSTDANPTTSGSCTDDGTGTGSYSSSLTGLTAGQSYHVRAYATNSAGTAYGREITFKTGKRPAKFILFAP